MNLAVVAAVSRIDPTAWTAIRYSNAIYDEDERRWISDAEVAESPTPRSRPGPRPSTLTPG